MFDYQAKEFTRMFSTVDEGFALIVSPNMVSENAVMKYVKGAAPPTLVIANHGGGNEEMNLSLVGFSVLNIEDYMATGMPFLDRRSNCLQTLFLLTMSHDTHCHVPHSSHTMSYMLLCA